MSRRPLPAPSKGAASCGSCRATSGFRSSARPPTLMLARQQELGRSSAWKKARRWPKASSKPRGPPRRSSSRPKRPSGSAAKCCRWTARRAARASSASRSACRAASSWRSRRSTFRSTSSATRSARRWPRGNAVIVKPASDTPLSALKLVEILLEAGLPPLAIACLTGSGGELGKLLCSDERVRKISFTGSVEVGKQICAVAGIKRVTMELGSQQPADRAGRRRPEQGRRGRRRHRLRQRRAGLHLDAAGDRRWTRSMATCSTRSSRRSKAITTGDPLDEGTKMGPMIRERDAVRVGEWIDEAVAAGAQARRRRLAAAARCIEPTLLADVQPDDAHQSATNCSARPSASPRRATIDEAIAPGQRHALRPIAPASSRRTSTAAIKFAREVDAGNLHINWGPAWRADLMPYGGLKDSGFGKEGPQVRHRRDDRDEDGRDSHDGLSSLSRLRPGNPRRRAAEDILVDECCRAIEPVPAAVAAEVVVRARVEVVLDFVVGDVTPVVAPPHSSPP